MRVTVRYVAMLREARGLAEEVVDVGEPSTVDALFGRLFPNAPVPVGYAVNHQQVRSGHPLAEGDLVVFLPPVGGG